LFHLCRSTIRDKIIPHAVSWFTGEALQGEDLEDEDEEGDEDDEDEEDDEDDEDEDEEEDEEDDDEEEVRGRKVQYFLYSSYCCDFSIVCS
jgi:nucleosome assembly protein 1-like 1